MSSVIGFLVPLNLLSLLIISSNGTWHGFLDGNPTEWLLVDRRLIGRLNMLVETLLRCLL
jgi:hypothetical protein